MILMISLDLEKWGVNDTIRMKKAKSIKNKKGVALKWTP